MIEIHFLQIKVIKISTNYKFNDIIEKRFTTPHIVNCLIQLNRKILVLLNQK